MDFSDIISTGPGAEAKPLLQLRAKSGSAFIVLAGKEEKSHGAKCWFNITYRYTGNAARIAPTHVVCRQFI